jgi:hypothetical protein
VLLAQAEAPFQLLVPAYLPAGFERKQVEIQTGLEGPGGEAMVRLVYTHPLGVTLTLSEWMPAGANAAGSTAGSGVQRCTCMCQAGVCSAGQLMVDNGPVRISGETSDPQLLSPEHVRLILTTLAPAGGLLTYTTLEEVPVPGLPPAEEIPVNADGVQELVLVAAVDGYTPAHFSVRKGIPVRLSFRQLGDVGCGNELYFQWSAQDSALLVLSGAGDTKVLEFTPAERGDFLFHCPHYIYQGVMSVVE